MVTILNLRGIMDINYTLTVSFIKYTIHNIDKQHNEIKALSAWTDQMIVSRRGDISQRILNFSAGWKGVHLDSAVAVNLKESPRYTCPHSRSLRSSEGWISTVPTGNRMPGPRSKQRMQENNKGK
jgi:hypothetical protein